MYRVLAAFAAATCVNTACVIPVVIIEPPPDDHVMTARERDLARAEVEEAKKCLPRLAATWDHYASPATELEFIQCHARRANRQALLIAINRSYRAQIAQMPECAKRWRFPDESYQRFEIDPHEQDATGWLLLSTQIQPAIADVEDMDCVKQVCEWQWDWAPNEWTADLCSHTRPRTRSAQATHASSNN